MTSSYLLSELAELSVEVPFSRTLQADSRRLPYRDANLCKLTMHSGQRKLLMAEVEFLTKYGDLSKTVVYAGAAPGIHTPFLSKLFPEHDFYLYDPARFYIRSNGRVRIVRDYFTDTTAQHIADSFGSCLFMSDIRRGGSRDAFEDMVAEDLEMQRRWVSIIKPKMSLLKFRIPFNVSGDFEYLDGDIYLQPWAPTGSAETRLVTDGARSRTYDAKQYEEQMYRHNTVSRQQAYAHGGPLGLVRGLDYCYDCASEVHIWKEYLKGVGKSWMPANVATLMNEASNTCKGLIRGNHGKVCSMAPTFERLQAIGI